MDFDHDEADALFGEIDERFKQASPENLPEKVRSWYLEVNGGRHWISREDGARLRMLAAMNPSGIVGSFDFVPLDDGLPVVIQITRDTSFVLLASTDS